MTPISLMSNINNTIMSMSKKVASMRLHIQGDLVFAKVMKMSTHFIELLTEHCHYQQIIYYKY